MKLSVLWLLIFINLFQRIACEVPWGKDAALAFYKPIQMCHRIQEHDPLAEAGIRCIRFHKEVISPADGPRSHFRPNSSQYTLDAMQKYGFFVGVIRGCDRLMRENSDPWVYPVTTDGSGHYIKSDPLR